MKMELNVREDPAASSAPSAQIIHKQPQEEPNNLRKVLKLLGRWILTIVFTILILVVARTYLDKGIITKTQKATYNLIQTALTLALGLNFFEAFKELVSVLKRKIGAWARCDDQERQLMEEIDSLLTVWCLLRKYYAKPRIAIFCVAWVGVSFWYSLISIIDLERQTYQLALNLIAQMAVASISLTYSVDDGTDYQSTFIRDGIVNASYLSCYQRAGLDCKTSIATGHALAHAYGESGSPFACGEYTELAEVLKSTTYYMYYCRQTPQKQEFAYRFIEYNPADESNSYPHFTNRIITAWSGACLSYNVTGMVKVPEISNDGQGQNMSYGNSTFNGSINIPGSALGLASTTYIYRDNNPPEENPATACGDRCIMMWASKNPGASPNASTTLYQCPINVSPVSNATQDAHQVPASVARIAAASIALQGRWSLNNGDRDYTQYQYYAYGSEWDIHSFSDEDIGPTMARFAIQSLAMLATQNQTVSIRGSVPYLGSRLVVNWWRFIALLSCIVGAHFALFAVTVLWVTKVAKADMIKEPQKGIMP